MRKRLKVAPCKCSNELSVIELVLDYVADAMPCIDHDDSGTKKTLSAGFGVVQSLGRCRFTTGGMPQEPEDLFGSHPLLDCTWGCI